MHTFLRLSLTMRVLTAVLLAVLSGIALNGCPGRGATTSQGEGRLEGKVVISTYAGLSTDTNAVEQKTEPFAHAIVQVLDHAGDLEESIETDEDGTFSLEIEPGRYWISTPEEVDIGSAIPPGILEVEVAPGQTVTALLRYRLYAQ